MRIQGKVVAFTDSPIRTEILRNGDNWAVLFENRRSELDINISQGVSFLFKQDFDFGMWSKVKGG